MGYRVVLETICAPQVLDQMTRLLSSPKAGEVKYMVSSAQILDRHNVHQPVQTLGVTQPQCKVSRDEAARTEVGVTDRWWVRSRFIE